uniref:BESS domain-containing protein n=1 Tax=Heliothis virescens TaxID=7102 RepID=A0A2A4JKT0_HELVI
MKCHKKLSESKSGSGANPSVHKYTYYDNMIFLTKIAQHRNTESNMVPPCNTESDDSHDTSMIKKKKKYQVQDKNLSAVDIKMMQFIDSMQKEEKKTSDDSRIMSFFKSVAPTVEQFNDDEVIEFQYQVISILRNFKQRKLNSNTSESQNIQLQQPIQPQPTYDTEAYGYSTAAVPSNVRSQEAYGYSTAPGPSNVRSQSRLTNYSSELEFDTYTRIEQSQPSVQSSMSDDLDFATLN